MMPMGLMSSLLPFFRAVPLSLSMVFPRGELMRPPLSRCSMMVAKASATSLLESKKSRMMWGGSRSMPGAVLSRKVEMADRTCSESTSMRGRGFAWSMGIGFVGGGSVGEGYLLRSVLAVE